jgi:hypothetical protein
VLTVNMTDGPPPEYEAAYSRLLRLIRGSKPLLDSLLALTDAQRADNWKVRGIRLHRDIQSLQAALKRDKAFRGYLVEKVGFHFGTPYAEKLLRVFCD